MKFQSLLRKIRHPKLWKLSFEKWGLMHLSDKEYRLFIHAVEW